MAGDTANVTLSTNGYTATFASAGVGNGIGVTVSGLTLSGSACHQLHADPARRPDRQHHYRRPVTITPGVSANNKVYDGTPPRPSAPITWCWRASWPGTAANVKLSTNGYTATFASPGVGTGIAVTVSGLTLTGSAATNYTLTQPAGLTANITAAPVTVISGLTANNKVYDGTTAATLSASTVVLSGVLAGDAGNVTLSTNGYTASVCQRGRRQRQERDRQRPDADRQRGGQLLPDPTDPLTANITAAPVTVSSGVTANNKVYDAHHGGDAQYQQRGLERRAGRGHGECEALHQRLHRDLRRARTRARASP